MAGAEQAGREGRTPRPGDRIPPHSVDAERAVLGCIMQDSGRVIDNCIQKKISAESFYVQSHRTLFETMMALHEKGTPVDIVTVSDRLREAQALEGVGGEEELARLIDGTPTTAHDEYYIQIVYQNHLLRKIIDSSRDLTEKCYRGGENDAETLLNYAEETFFALGEQRTTSEQLWGGLIKKEMEEIETLISEKKGLTGISTGFTDIDHMLLGLQKADLLILAARPSMGKTSLALNMAENVALGSRKQPPRPVAVFSLEMAAEQLVRRMICCRAGVSGQDLSSGKVGVSEHGKLVAAADALRGAPIYVDDSAGLDIMDLRARARRMKAKYGIEFIVVDYLQLMNCAKFAGENRQRETAAISQGLKHMAKELRVPVLVLSQLSRAPETRDTKSAVPKLSDLRDSGSIEQDADVVMLLRRPSYYKGDKDYEDKRLAIVDIAKHRNGPTGEVKLDFDNSYTRFGNRANFGAEQAE